MIQSLRHRLLDRFVLRPSRHDVAYEGKERRTFEDDGMVDEYFVQFCHPDDESFGKNDSADPPVDLLVLKFPGTAGRAERASQWPCGLIDDSTLKVVSWNAPGYGGSHGRASLRTIPQRADQFATKLWESFSQPPRRVWLIGNSLGCATAAYVASRSGLPIDGLILRNPPPLRETFKRVAGRYPLGWLTDRVAESVVEEMDLIQTAPRISVPTLMLTSEFDSLVPPKLQRQVFDLIQADKRLVIMEGLEHDSVATEEHEEPISQGVRWLWETGTATE